jgi:hypothetical protein
MHRRTVVALALAAAAACDAGSFERGRRAVGRLQHVHRPAGPVALTVRLGRGEVQVVAGDGRDVRFELGVWLRRERPATDFVPELAAHLAIAERAGTLAVADAHLGAADAADWELRLTVKVPAGLDLDLRVESGEVGVRLPSTNDVHAGVGAGKVHVAVDEVAGACRLRAGTGQVTAAISGQGPAGGLDAVCATGEVHLELPAGVRGTFELDVGTGGIQLDPRFAIEVERRVTAASARGHVGLGGPPLRARVEIGQIVVR